MTTRAKLKIWFLDKDVEEKLREIFNIEIDEGRQFVYIKEDNDRAGQQGSQKQKEVI